MGDRTKGFHGWSSIGDVLAGVEKTEYKPRKEFVVAETEEGEKIMTKEQANEYYNKLRQRYGL